MSERQRRETPRRHDATTPRRRETLFSLLPWRRGVVASWRSPLALLAAASLALATPAFAQPRPAPGAGKVDVGEDVGIAIGETKFVSARDVKNYADGGTDVIDVRLTSDGAQFVITGKKVGSATLALIKADGSSTTYGVTVYARSPAAVERELTQLLEGTNGVRIRKIGGRLFVEGRVSSDADLHRVQQIAALYPGQVESLVSVGTAGIERKILIRIDFYFAQYEKTSSYTVGIGWPANVGAANVAQSTFGYDFVAKTITTATASLVNQPLPRLDVAASNGWAKVFKQATVVTNNGSEAVFESGGEQNFSVNTGLTIGVQKIQFGAFLNVHPIFNPQSRELDVKVDANVADLTSPISSTLPGRNTSKLQTTVHMKLGQSLVLSGIRTRSQTHNVTGLPVLSEIPVLGLLFASHANTTDDTEGAIFIVPSIVESVPKPAQEMIENALHLYHQFDGNLAETHPYDHNPPPPPVPR